MSVKVTCCKCKMDFWMADSFHDTMLRLREAGTFYCPAGHGQSYVAGKTEAEKAREEADRQRRLAERAIQRAAMLEDDLVAARRSAAAYKGRATRMTNRAKAGICPCCNRHFVNLERHMSAKHTDIELEALVEGVVLPMRGRSAPSQKEAQHG